MIDRAALRKIWLVICWIIVVPSVFIIFPVGYLVFNKFYERVSVALLYRKVAINGEYKLSDHHQDWDDVCVALPYCGEGTGLMTARDCSPFLTNGRWGLIYYKNKKISGVYKYGMNILYKGTDRCYNIKENPKFIIYNGEDLTIYPK